MVSAILSAWHTLPKYMHIHDISIPFLNYHFLYEALFKVLTPTLPHAPDSLFSLSSMAIVYKKVYIFLICIHYLLFYSPLQNVSPVRLGIAVLFIDLS